MSEIINDKNGENKNAAKRIVDNGTRQEYITGAHKEIQKGKGAFYLIPYEAMELLALRFEEGALKYGERDWEKGMPISDCVSSAMRHILKYAWGWNDETHLGAALWNIAAICYYEKKHKDNKEVCNLPHHFKKKGEIKL